MIPRYDPTYTFSDLFQCAAVTGRDTSSDELASRLKQIYQVRHAFLFESARVALYAILRAHNRPGKVLMPAYNCIVVPEAVRFAGYEPVFLDIDLSTLNVRPETIQAALTEDCRAILATHLFGIPCDMDALKAAVESQDILWIEDAAPALGAEYHGQLVGNFSDAAIISFQATKVLSAENGGALLTNNDELAERIRGIQSQVVEPGGRLPLLLKALGRKVVTHPAVYPVTQAAFQAIRRPKMYEIVEPLERMPENFFSSCPPFTASLILQQLNNLSRNLSARRELACIYQQELSGFNWLSMPLIPDHCSPAWIQFPILVEDKVGLFEFMQRKGVDLSWTFRYSCADSYGVADCPKAQKAAKSMLGLPTYPSLTTSQARKICSILRTYRPMHQ